MRLSDIITNTILNMLNESEGNSTEIKRNELASLIGCVPSQINYVLSSRFTPDHGDIIESRRGGGGYVKITRISLDKSSALMHIINSIGNGLEQVDARVLIENCVMSDILNKNAAEIMKAAISNSVLSTIPKESQNAYRAALIKQLLMTQI